MFPETRNTNAASVPSYRLWFGFAGSAASWAALGVSDLLITSAACTQQEKFGLPGERPSVPALFAVVTVLLFLTTITAGLVSYRNWRALSGSSSLLDMRSDDRSQFMAFMGVVVSVTLGFGILWLALPPLMLELCWRAR